MSANSVVGMRIQALARQQRTKRRRAAVAEALLMVLLFMGGLAVMGAFIHQQAEARGVDVCGE